MIDVVYKLIVDISTRCGVSVDDVLSRTRGKSPFRARALAMLVLRERYGFSFPEIGKIFDRDHTTVMCALPKARLDPLASTLLAEFGGQPSTLRPVELPKDGLDVAAA